MFYFIVPSFLVKYNTNCFLHFINLHSSPAVSNDTLLKLDFIEGFLIIKEVTMTFTLTINHFLCIYLEMLI